MEFKENKPIYLQIADSIMDRIQRGELPPGERIPSVREYAMQTAVNPNTVMRTYTWLQQEGLLQMQRGIGYFVTASAPARITEMRSSRFFSEELLHFFDRLHSFGVSPDLLRQKYADYLSSR